MRHVSIIIPAYNEADRLPKNLKACIDFLNQQQYTSEIIVVTDGSQDNTAEVAESFKAEFGDLKVVTFPFNRGRGFAVREAMKQAMGEYRLYMDADGAVPIDFLNNFLKICKDKNADLVIGSRDHKDSRIIRRQNFFRHYLKIPFKAFQRFLLKMPYKDTQCGFKLFTKTASDLLFARSKFDCSFSDTEYLYIAFKLNLKVIEAPVTWCHNNETRLPIGPRRAISLLLKLFAIKKSHAKI